MELNKIYNMDCVIGIRNILANESVDLIIADPPYFIDPEYYEKSLKRLSRTQT